MGRLADRIGPIRVFLGGQALLVLVDALLLKTDPGSIALVVMLAALGTYYAATDGILAVIATGILPENHRASGLALLDGIMALMAFVASTLFGALWQWRGVTFVVTVFLGGLLITLIAAVLLLRPLLAREATTHRVIDGRGNHSA
jgi:MFS family permease